MTGLIESLRSTVKSDNTASFDAENFGKAVVSAHHYLHHVLLAGNFTQIAISSSESAEKEQIVDATSQQGSVD